MAVAHYLDGLAWQREVVKLHTIFGGKNPHPNFLVGGAPSPISAGPEAGAGGAATTAVNVVTLAAVRDIIGNNARLRRRGLCTGYARHRPLLQRLVPRAAKASVIS